MCNRLKAIEEVTTFPKLQQYIAKPAKKHLNETTSNHRNDSAA